MSIAGDMAAPMDAMLLTSPSLCVMQLFLKKISNLTDTMGALAFG